jgi:alpha-galactosidase/6-phospho-beta-glucosidase family protein
MNIVFIGAGSVSSPVNCCATSSPSPSWPASGNRRAATADPATAAALTVDEIWALCDAMVAAHGDALPPALRGSLQS